MGWFWGFSILCESSTEGFFRFRGFREEERARPLDLERALEEERDRDRDLDRAVREEGDWWWVVEAVVSVRVEGVRGSTPFASPPRFRLYILDSVLVFVGVCVRRLTVLLGTSSFG